MAAKLGAARAKLPMAADDEKAMLYEAVGALREMRQTGEGSSAVPSPPFFDQPCFINVALGCRRKLRDGQGLHLVCCAGRYS